MVTLGKFDGVHAGHRHLIRCLAAEADRRSAEPVVLVLHPHPQEVLTGTSPDILTTVAERKRRIASLGVRHVELFAFTSAVAALTPEAFLDRLLAHFELAALVVGPDFAFGRGREGDLDALRQFAAAGGYDVVVVPKQQLDGEVVSSRNIRSLLGRGEVDAARSMLGMPHTVEGDVVRGAARGRSLGFPTANLFLADPYVLPSNGIYAVRTQWVDVDGRPRSAEGVASVGVRPTFDNGERLLEVFILDHDEDLYGLRLAVQFIEHLRPETRFDTVEDLVNQMRIDVAEAREALSRDAHRV